MCNNNYNFLFLTERPFVEINGNHKQVVAIFAGKDSAARINMKSILLCMQLVAQKSQQKDVSCVDVLRYQTLYNKSFLDHQSLNVKCRLVIRQKAKKNTQEGTNRSLRNQSDPGLYINSTD